MDVGDEEANLLLPLYLVVGALALALGWRLLRGDERSRELGPAALPLAAFVAWTGITLAWSEDVREGSIFLLAFLLPFGLLAIGFARLPWSRRALLGLYGALAATALAYASVGIFQWATRDVFWNPRVIVGNAYAPFYRVNSVFWDPSIYGRYLVVAILATLALVLLGVRLRWLAVGIVADRSDLGGPALLLLAVELRGARGRDARRGDDRLALACGAALGLVAVVLITVGFATPQVRDKLLGSRGPGSNNATSGRASLVANGIRIARDNPRRGRRGRRLQARLRRPHRAEAAGSQEGRVALDARHRRGGERAYQAPPARVAGGRGALGTLPAAVAAAMPDALALALGLRLARSPCTASSTTLSSRIRPPGPCWAWLR